MHRYRASQWVGSIGNCQGAEGRAPNPSGPGLSESKYEISTVRLRQRKISRETKFPHLIKN